LFISSTDSLDSSRELHRRIAPFCLSPSIVWHFALWPDPEIRELKSVADQKAAKADWLADLNKPLRGLEEILTGKSDNYQLQFNTADRALPNVRPSFSEVDADEPTRNSEASEDSLYFCRVGKNFCWQVKVESHYEFSTFTIILSPEKPNSDWVARSNPADAPWPAALQKAGINIEDIKAAIDAQKNSVRSADAATDHDASAADDALVKKARFVYREVWLQLGKAIVETGHLHYSFSPEGPLGISLERSKALNELYCNKFRGHLIADFRGLVLPLPATYEIDGSEVTDKSTNDRVTDDPEDHKRALSRHAALILHKAEPLLRAISHGDDAREYVGCGMIDNRYVYLSTLAAKNNPPSDGGLQPVKYLLVSVVPPKRYQTGRLIERIHTQGVTRIVALRGLTAIKEAGRELQAMGLELDAFNRDRGAWGPVALLQNTWGRFGALQSMIKQLNQLGLKSKPSALHGEAAATDGVAYRIIRSRYYAFLLNERMQDLRITRIEGWQPYDEFLRRRLSPTLKFIDDVGHRMAAIRSRIDSIIWLADLQQARLLNIIVGVLTFFAVAIGLYTID